MLAELRRSVTDPVNAWTLLGAGASDFADESARRSWRSAYLAGYVDRRVLASEVGISAGAAKAMTFGEFDAYVEAIWSSIGRSEPILVSSIEDLPRRTVEKYFNDADAAARWEYPGADRMGVPRTGKLAGTSGLVAFVDVRAAGLLPLVAAHEVAHLLADGFESTAGHSETWAGNYGGVQTRLFGEELAKLWAFEWSWYLQKAVDYVAEDPGWLM